MKNYDFVVIGAGIYGLYTAKLLSAKYNVLVIDADDYPFSRASWVNQARLHNGYHYPRSKETAIQASNHFDRFQRDFSEAIFKDFDQVYAIASSGSLTNPEQFESFCSAVKIPLKEINSNGFFVEGSIQKAYLTKEYALNYSEVSAKLLKNSMFHISLKTVVTSVKKKATHFILTMSNGEIIETGGVINTTYASLNQVNRLFDVEPAPMKYELCELVLCKPPKNMTNSGITVMDGPFFSLMPFGRKDKYSLWSVKHSVIETSHQQLPAFTCQLKGNTCNQLQLNNCNSCQAAPKSSFQKMKNLVSEFLQDPEIEYHGSAYTVKAISKEAESDDSRLVYFKKHSSEPYYAHVFSGKINCIYELDSKLLELL